MKVLHLDSGIFIDQSVSRQLTRDILSQLKNNQETTVVYRDLVANPVDHLTAEGRSNLQIYGTRSTGLS